MLICSTLAGTALAAPLAPVAMGSAAPFAVMAAATITNTGPSTVNGDIGLSPGTAITGLGSLSVVGSVHAADAAAALAQADLTAAYVDAAARPGATVSPGDIGGMTLAPGVYKSGSSLGLTGTVTLDGGGDPNAVFIFQIGS
ncbi:MAG: hypothetical protein QOG43_366, partial [Actinomycetota bacterium]|nr:hypothetical protein [Actinomycetota bacterium]